MALRKGLLLLASIAAWWTSAAAQDVSGHYRMEGVDTTGRPYTGTADIARSFKNTCTIKFSDGPEGICMLNGSTLTGAYIIHGKSALVIYDLHSDGSLEGPFIVEGHGSIGKETLTPIR